MKFSIVSLAILATSALAGPVVKQANIDLVVLQFALTLEHLENVFYKEALSKLSEAQFLAAGYSKKYYKDLKYIAHDEESHVKLLTAGIKAAGGKPVAACKYSFPITDVKSFITLSSILEGVGTSAYLGGAPLITSKDYLTIAGSILVTEALHTSLQRSALNRVPSADPYGTPLSPSPVFTLAAAFIKSCPSSNMALPFKSFPGLTTTQSTPVAQLKSVKFTTAKNPPSRFFVTFINGLDIVSVAPTSVQGRTFQAKVPAGFGGQAYVLITTCNVSGGPITDEKILYGPAIIEVIPSFPIYNNNYLK